MSHFISYLSLLIILVGILKNNHTAQYVQTTNTKAATLSNTKMGLEYQNSFDMEQPMLLHSSACGNSCGLLGVTLNNGDWHAALWRHCDALLHLQGLCQELV